MAGFISNAFATEYFAHTEFAGAGQYQEVVPTQSILNFHQLVALAVANNTILTIQQIVKLQIEYPEGTSILAFKQKVWENVPNTITQLIQLVIDDEGV